MIGRLGEAAVASKLLTACGFNTLPPPSKQEEDSEQAAYNAAKERAITQVTEHKTNTEYMTQTFINPALLKKYKLNFDPTPDVTFYSPAHGMKNSILTVGHLGNWRVLAYSLYSSNGNLENFGLTFYTFSFGKDNSGLALPEMQPFTSVNTYGQPILDIHQPKQVFETVFSAQLDWPQPPSTPGGELKGTSTIHPVLEGSLVHNGDITLAVKDPRGNNLQSLQ